MKDEVDLFVNLIELKSSWEDLKKELPIDEDAEYNYSVETIDDIFKTFTQFIETFKKDIKCQRTLIEYGI